MTVVIRRSGSGVISVACAAIAGTVLCACRSPERPVAASPDRPSTTSHDWTTSAAPPLRVCGTTVYSGAAGAVVTDASGSVARVTSLTSGAGIYLKLSDSCAHGATLIVPIYDATVVATAHTSDGAIAFVGLTPKRGKFTLVAKRPGGLLTTISIEIADLPTSGRL
jgi:hypothetical protein